MLKATGNLGANSVDTPVKVNKLLMDGEFTKDPRDVSEYSGKSNLSQFTQPALSHSGNIVSECIHASQTTHLKRLEEFHITLRHLSAKDFLIVSIIILIL